MAGYDFLTMPKESYGNHMFGWDRLAATAEINVKDLGHMSKEIEVLKEALAEAREAKHRQIVLRAAAQQASRDLEAAMEKANEVAVRLNQGILSRYGNRSEKLVEFGLRPWRPRRPKAAAEAPEADGNAAQSAPDAPKPRRKRRS